MVTDCSYLQNYGKFLKKSQPKTKKRNFKAYKEYIMSTIKKMKI